MESEQIFKHLFIFVTRRYLALTGKRHYAWTRKSQHGAVMIRNHAPPGIRNYAWKWRRYLAPLGIAKNGRMRHKLAWNALYDGSTQLGGKTLT